MPLITSPTPGEVLEPSGAPTVDPGLLVLLRRASSMIDSMWHTALAENGQHHAVPLAEASQGVHRALIALGALERSSFDTRP